MWWLTHFYDFRFKSTATTAIGIHPTKTWLSQLVIFKNAIWMWGHYRRTIGNKILFNTWRKCHRNMEFFRLLLNHLAWIEHQFSSGILVTDYLTKMSIKTVPHPPNSRDLVPCDFWLFPKLRGCRYETTEGMKEAVTKVIDTLTQKDFHGERYNKCIVAGGDYFEGD